MLNNYIKKIFKSRRKEKKNLELHEPSFNKNETTIIKKCIQNREVSSAGNFTSDLENIIKKKLKCKNVIATNSGTSALHLALLALGIKKDDEILMPSLNYIASANACLYIGATPHFVDVETKTLGIDVQKLDTYLKEITFTKNKFCINKKTKRKVKAIICLHAFGHPCEVDKIKRLANRYNLFLIEDAAEALGSYYKKKHVGTFGDIGILSFNGNKIITTGVGGAILTNNQKLAKLSKHLTTTAKKYHKWDFVHDMSGYNYRLANINASLGISQIKKLNKQIRLKRNLFKKYKKILGKSEDFLILDQPYNSRSNFWLQTLVLLKPSATKKNKVLKSFHENKILARPVWRPLHKIKFLKKYPKMNLKNADIIENKLINIPSSFYL